jgi:L-seryl-tRNA(Ser) seleniumtransferase
MISSVSDLLADPEISVISGRFGEALVKSELRVMLDELRAGIRTGDLKDVPCTVDLAGQLMSRLIRFASPEGRRAINASGILLHTGLGRSPLCGEAIEALSGMGRYSLLQLDTASGKRSLREEKIERMLVELTGCEAATVVNNNAAATMLVLNTLAAGKNVILSRGQLIEIGGEFRMPDVMARSSVILREVGTTNRTHLHDYERAIDGETGALLHVHTSNYRVRGFSGTPGIDELSALGMKYNLPVIDDIGSGALVRLSSFGITDEPLLARSVAAGCDAVMFSGDKLICGPQAGIICGKKKVIERIRKNPFMRMFRVSKLTAAALEATLIHFINGTYGESFPFYRMLSYPPETLKARADVFLNGIKDVVGIKAVTVDDISYVGSGSLPDEGIPTKAVRVSFIDGRSGGKGLESVSSALRNGIPSVLARVQDDAIYFDMRTLFDGEEKEAAAKLVEVIGRGAVIARAQERPKQSL